MKLYRNVLIVIILITSILIGTPIQYNCIGVNVAIIFVGICFAIYLHYMKKEQIFTNKIDIAVFILCISPLIPIVCKTYINLQDTVVYLLKYMSCFVIYLLSKHLTKQDSKNKEMIIHTIIISSILLCMIGIDNMTTKLLTKPLEALGLPFVFNLENRMFSSLGYANSFAIIVATAIMLNLYCIEKNTSKYRFLYAGVIFLNLSCLVLTYSRATLLFLMLALAMYTFIKYNKSKFVMVGYTMIVNAILSLLYIMKWNQMVGKEDYASLWMITFVLIGIAIICQKIGETIQEKMLLIPMKIYITIIIITVIVIIILIAIGMNFVVPLTIFQEGESSKTVKYKVTNVEPNTQYSFQFDIHAESNWKTNDNYEIIIDEENKYYDLVTSHKITFNQAKGIQEISFKSSEETIEVAIYFESQSKKAQKRFDSKITYH